MREKGGSQRNEIVLLTERDLYNEDYGKQIKSETSNRRID